MAEQVRDNEPGKASAWDQYEYTKIYNALKDLEEYNVSISIPEFVFIGFQSSGKTSAVSQAAKLAVGVMKHGTASRCPTRFKLISNKNQEKPLIKVNGILCADETDLTNKTCELTKELNAKDIFSKDIIEVRIESAQVPELTFVDLPGLIKGDNQQFAHAKQQLDELTAHFLHDTNPDGTYRYIPILVREPVDVEHDTHHEVNYIDSLVEKYGHGRKKRIGWRDDTLFIVNKFDKQINRSPASSLIEYMRYCCEYGQTVLTIMNAKGENTANMDQMQLNKFVLSVQMAEERKWSMVLSEFNKMDDENLNELQQLKMKCCGVSKMNEILANKMCDIVKKILPFVEMQLNLSETEKRNEIAGIMKQIDMCDPQKLKAQCIMFNNKFLKNLQNFYNGSLNTKIDKKYKKSWEKEVNDFHVMASASSSNTGATDWKYEIAPSKLQTLLKKLSKKPKPSLLLSLLGMELLGSSGINRIIDAWVCQVGYMTFPLYSDEDIWNICGGFDSTKQAQLWTSIRNVVLDAVQHLSDSISFLAEMFRYKLKENAEICFEYTLLSEFGSIDITKNSTIHLLQRTLRNYKSEVDNIINEFIDVATIEPVNHAQILDKMYCEETINIGRLISRLLDPKNKENNVRLTTPPITTSSSSKNSYPAPPPPPGPGPPPSSSSDNNNNNNNKQTPIVHEYHLYKGKNKGDNNKKKKNDKKGGPSPMLSKRTKSVHPGINEELKDEIKEFDEMKRESENAYNSQKYDGLYYLAMNGVSLNYPMSYDANNYDILFIRHLSFVFWTNIKHFIIRDITQKLLNIVMSPINQHNERFADAIQCGVDGQQIQKLVNKLVDKTGIDIIELEKLINSASTIQIEKAINDLNNKELEEVYGVNRDTLIKEKNKKIKQLKNYKKLKQKTLLKIYHIKNNNFDDIQNEASEYEENGQNGVNGGGGRGNKQKPIIHEYHLYKGGDKSDDDDDDDNNDYMD